MSNLLLIHIIVACVAWGIAIYKILELVIQKLSPQSTPMPSHGMTPEFTPDDDQLQDVRQSVPSPAPQPGNHDVSPDDVAVTSEINQILAQCESDSLQIHHSIDRIARELDELAAVRTEFEAFLRTLMICPQCQNDRRMQELPSVNDDKKNELVSVQEVATPLLKERPDPETTDAVEEKPKPDFDEDKEETEDVSVPQSLAQLWTGALALQDAKDETTETGNDIENGVITSGTQALIEANMSLVPYQPPRPQTDDQPAIVHATELGTEKRPDSVEMKNEPRVDETEKTVDDSTAIVTALPLAGGTEPETALPLAGVTESETALPPADSTSSETVLPQAEGTARKRALLPADKIAFLEALIKLSKEPNQMSRAKYEKRLEKLVENETRRLNKRKDGTTSSKKRSAREEKRIQKAITKLEMIYEDDLSQLERVLKGPRSKLDIHKNASISDEKLRNEIKETIRSYETAENIVVKAAESEIALKQDKLAKAKELLLKPNEIEYEPRTDDPEKTAESAETETALPPAELTLTETALPPVEGTETETVLPSAEGTEIETAQPSAEGTEIETALPPAEGTEIETALPPADEIEPAALAQTTPNESPERDDLEKFITFFEVLIEASKKPNRKSRAKYEKRMKKLIEKETKRLNKRKNGTTSPKKRSTKEENRIIKAITTLEMIYDDDKEQMKKILQGQRADLDFLKNAVSMIANENRQREVKESTRLKETALNIVVRDAESEIAFKQDMLARDREFLLKPADSE
ncbi:hypothetical protein GHT06_021266 [Daphnia sinensis]|uniref:Uncharacterized protein n=1 Tax=Daphnia sinensis TaxID=1820382 RepID=A0AAD5PSD4_9CRUS|nr:hypothetical protein GHT06_021266 [Daphnia sinensis]